MAFPKVHNFDYYRGDTFEFNIDLKNQDGTDFDVTTFETFAFKLANQRGSTGTQVTATAIRVDPGTVRCTIIPSVGRTLTAGDYVYDVQITDTTPDPDIIYTILTGIITVTDDITGAV
jgi:hypothetical protein